MSATLVNGVPTVALAGSKDSPINTSAELKTSVQSSLKFMVSLHQPSGQVSVVQTDGSGAVSAVSEHAHGLQANKASNTRVMTRREHEVLG